MEGGGSSDLSADAVKAKRTTRLWKQLAFKTLSASSESEEVFQDSSKEDVSTEEEVVLRRPPIQASEPKRGSLTRSLSSSGEPTLNRRLSSQKLLQDVNQSITFRRYSTRFPLISFLSSS